MTKYNICVKKVYTKDGVEKAFWPSVGTLTYFPPYQDKQGGFRLELPIFGATQFYVFEQKAKTTPTSVDYPKESIDPADIPF